MPDTSLPQLNANVPSASSRGYLSAVEVHDPATKQSASWSGGTSKPNAQRYRCIVADPPWDHSDGTGFSYGARDPRGRSGKGAPKESSVPYGTMTVDEIRALPVGDWSEKNAHLYLWTTNRYLRDAYGVAEAWGFAPSCLLVWRKPAMGFFGKPFVNNLEFVLFCRRGTLSATGSVLGRCFDWPRGAHSAKPEAFQDMVQQVSPGPYLELFARRQRLGWHSWGNQAFCHVSMPGFEECVSELPKGEAVAPEGRKDNEKAQVLRAGSGASEQAGGSGQ